LKYDVKRAELQKLEEESKDDAIRRDKERLLQKIEEERSEYQKLQSEVVTVSQQAAEMKELLDEAKQSRLAAIIDYTALTNGQNVLRSNLNELRNDMVAIAGDMILASARPAFRPWIDFASDPIEEVLSSE
jgi:predicted nuclease with TOPRIM domain